MWALRPQYENKGSNKLCRDLEDQINCVAAYLCADGVFVIALDLSKAPLNPSHLSENCDLLSYRHYSSQTNLFILNPKIVSFNGLSGLEYSSQLTRGGGKGTRERVSWIWLCVWWQRGCTWNSGDSGNFKENQYKFGSRIIILKSVAKCTFVVVETVFISVFIYFTPSSNIFFVPISNLILFSVNLAITETQMKLKLRWKA